MATGLTYGIATTLSNARVYTGVIDARSVVRAFIITLAFSTYAVAEWIAGVSRKTGANGTFLAGVVVAGYALSICSTRVGTAQIFFGEWTATDEGITSHVTRAATDWSQAT